MLTEVRVSEARLQDSKKVLRIRYSRYKEQKDGALIQNTPSKTLRWGGCEGERKQG